MRNIFIKETELLKLEKVKIRDPQKCEGVFYFYSVSNKKMIMKIMKNTHNYYSSQGLKAIQILLEYKNTISEVIPEFVVPEALVYIDSILKGYLMNFIEGVKLQEFLENPNIEFKQKIYILQNIGIILDKPLNLSNFPYFFHFGDLHEGNIMITSNGNIKILDSNGISIFQEDVNSKYLHLCKSNLFCRSKYQTNQVDDPIASRDTDILCYMMIVMNFISQSNFSEFPFYKINDYLKYLKSINFSEEFLNCIDKLYTSENNINPYPYLENITEDMLEKANMNAYIKSLS